MESTWFAPLLSPPSSPPHVQVRVSQVGGAVLMVVVGFVVGSSLNCLIVVVVFVSGATAVVVVFVSGATSVVVVFVSGAMAVVVVFASGATAVVVVFVSGATVVVVELSVDSVVLSAASVVMVE